MKWLVFLLLIALTTPGYSKQQSTIPSPEDYLGFAVGTERRLADYEQISEYFRLLDTASDRMLIKSLGTTTENRPFWVSIISAPENLRALHRYTHIQHQLYNPGGLRSTTIDSLIANGKVMVSINGSIHSTEVGPSQMAMQLAYDLVRSHDALTKQILANVIILLLPVHNPDGLQMVVDWYRSSLGTPYEGSPPPRLYHKYCGHDINRDWFLLSQRETRLTVEKIYNVFHPQVVLDMHQMGINAPRAFIPPYIDPVDSTIHPILLSEIAMLGQQIASDMIAAGKAGVQTNIIFDAWSPSRAYIHYHGGIRILSEIASCKLATPADIKLSSPMNNTYPGWNNPRPWTEGRWTLADIIDYSYHICRSLLSHVSRDRETWLRNFHRVQHHAVTGNHSPTAYIIPRMQFDPAAVLKMMRVLQRGDVRVHTLADSVHINHQTFHRDDFVVFANQPANAYIRTLLKPAHYPEQGDGLAYDATGHHLGHMFGVNVFPVMHPIPLATIPVNEIRGQGGTIISIADHTDMIAIPACNGKTPLLINRFLRAHIPVSRLTAPINTGRYVLPAGTFLVHCQSNHPWVKSFVDTCAAVCYALPRSTIPLPTQRVVMPHIGVYQSWVPMPDLGWTRYVLEKYQFPYRLLTNSAIQSGTITSTLNVIVIPDQNSHSLVFGQHQSKLPPEYVGGIGETGLQELRRFVRTGGTLIAIGRSLTAIIDAFSLPVNIINDDRLRAPGPQLTIEINNQHPIAYGMQRHAAVVYHHSPLVDAPGLKPIATFTEHIVPLAGSIRNPHLLQSKPALLQISYGQGHIVLFVFRPLFRGQTYALFKLLFNTFYQATSGDIYFSD